MSVIKRIIKFPMALFISLLRILYRLKSYVRLEYLIRFRHEIINIFAENITPLNSTKVLIVITHIVSKEESKSAISGKIKVERLNKTIDGIQRSFSHYSTKIIINTISERHIIQFLPQHQQNIVQVQEQNVKDPMFVEFNAQDIFLNHIDEYDYFLFLEDDIVIHDGSLLNKIAVFNEYSPDKKLVLFPHRYEMLNGVKTYIDISAINNQKCHWNKLLKIRIGDIEFAECVNPHAAFYCLSKEQMQIWKLSGRNWYNKVSSVGSLESAATFCLFEVFTLYKPHPKNINFLEVEHWDDKYSKMYNPEGKHFLDLIM